MQDLKMEKSSSSTALVWIFNYNMSENIQKLKSLYSGRFKNMWFMLPYCEEDMNDCIVPYFSHSYYFENAFYEFSKQSLPDSIKTVVFIGDDVVLNPSVDEHNILDKLQLADDEAFVQNAYPYSNWMLYRALHSNEDIFPRRELKNSLRAFNDSIELFSKFNSEGNVLQKMSKLFSGFSANALLDRDVAQLELNGKLSSAKALESPSSKIEDKFNALMSVCISDFLIVPRSILKEFGECCKLYGDNSIFVEYATLPCLLHCIEPQKIKSFCTQPVEFRFFTEAFFDWYDVFDPYQKWKKCINYVDMHDFMKNFPIDLIGIHQVKLSKYFC